MTIAVVGKYTDLSDAYLSVSKALYHASFHAERKLDIAWIDAENLVEVRPALALPPHTARFCPAMPCRRRRSAFVRRGVRT